MPFAAAQIGTAFRNEISPRSGLLRVREFTLAEIEYFCRKEELSEHSRFKEVEDIQLTLYSREAQLGTINRDLIKISAKQAVEQGIIVNQSLAYFMCRTYLWLGKIGIQKDKLRFDNI